MAAGAASVEITWRLLIIGLRYGGRKIGKGMHEAGAGRSPCPQRAYAPLDTFAQPLGKEFMQTGLENFLLRGRHVIGQSVKSNTLAIDRGK